MLSSAVDDVSIVEIIEVVAALRDFPSNRQGERINDEPSSSFPRYTCPEVISSVTTWPCVRELDQHTAPSQCSSRKYRVYATFVPALHSTT